MNFWILVRRNLHQHFSATFSSIICLTLGIALMVTVVALRDATHRQFTRTGLGVDAIVAPKGSPLQVVLNALYHLEEMPGKIGWYLVEELKKHPAVSSVTPFCTGHSFAGIRVNAVPPEFIDGYDIGFEQQLTTDASFGGQGRGFSNLLANEAVAGWEAARRLGIKIGDSFAPVCGVNVGDPVHHSDRLEFVGILAPTGTPHDRAIYMPLDRFYTLGGHGDNVLNMAEDLDSREISGVYVQMRRIRDGIMHPAVRELNFAVNQNPQAQFVIPNEVLPRLFHIIGWVDLVLRGVSILVILMAAVILAISLISALKARQHDYLLLRAIGARRSWLFRLVVAESVIICIIGGIAGLAFGAVLTDWSAGIIAEEAGILLVFDNRTALYLHTMIMLLVMGFGCGLVPAWQAYRFNVVKSFSLLGK